MSSFMEGGWDNDNFLDSLSRGNTESDKDNDFGLEAMDRANDEYFEQSKYGRPAIVESEEKSTPSTNSNPGTRLSYAEALKQRQQQRQEKLQQQQQQQQQDISAVSDAAAEIYAYSYNKEVDAPPSPSGVITLSSDEADAPQEPSEGEIKREAPLSKELVAKAKAAHDDEKEEASQGGSRFRELMERAKEKAKENPPQSPGKLELELQQKQLQLQQLQLEIQQLQQQQQSPQQQLQQPQSQQVQEQLSQQQQIEQQQLQQQQLQLQQAKQLQPPKPPAASTDRSVVTPSMIMTPEEVATLSIEEQARLYREFFFVQQQKKKTIQPQQKQQQQQSSPVSMGSSPDNYLEAGIGFDGKKIGSNRDADAISNASDVYFAQLKRDSTTRNLARYSGDNAKANEVFHDPAIQDIKAPVNPYLEDQQKRMRDVIETVPEEMLVFQEFEDEEGTLSKEELASYTGVSYKEKMEQKKREREEKRKRGNWSSHRITKKLFNSKIQNERYTNYVRIRACFLKEIWLERNRMLRHQIYWSCKELLSSAQRFRGIIQTIARLNTLVDVSRKSS